MRVGEVDGKSTTPPFPNEGKDGPPKASWAARNLEVVFLYEVAEAAVAEAQDFGRLGLHSAAAAERGLQQALFDVGNISFHVDAIGRKRNTGCAAGDGGHGHRSRLDGRIGQIHLEFRCAAHGDGALDGVFEDANVAGPVVSLEKFE